MREPDVCCPVLELRQYVLHPGRRDTLISLFERDLIEPQEEAGMRVIGQFRDLDDPDRFVWIRGFRDLNARESALKTFYGGPVWAAHRAQANATMVSSDNVLLVRPVDPGSGFSVDGRARPALDAPSRSSLLVATLYHLKGRGFPDFFDRHVRPVLAESGAPPLACLETEGAPNTFPALPVREGENVFIWFSSFESADRFQAHTEVLADDEVFPQLRAQLTRPPETLRLAPTTRSLLG